ncbi:DUF7553 family protein [Saliphagus infecundisoli]|uniref:Uncharacterized protein n=1 Tax=Saliphagus infecundisoli TaxID=1849069 RepID=A0ABD5QIM0_9EURY|nr:hypothetical protein [Saliphagus infecundisoli]
MAPDELRLTSAREELEAAAETADDDVREDVEETAAAFAELVDDGRTPDHALMDEHLNALRQAEERAEGETEDRIEQALSHAESYREELPQS